MLAVRSPDKAAPPWLEQVRQEQVAGLYKNVLVGMMSTWLAGGVLALLLVQQHVIDVAVAAVWFGIVTLLTIARVALALVYARAPDAKRAWRKWASWFTAGCIAGGLSWGVGSVFMMAPDRLDLQLLVIVLLSAIVYGALASFGRWIPAFYGFFLPAMIPTAIWSLAQGDVVHVAYALLAAIWIPSVAWLALRFNAGVVQALTLGFENAALAEDLRAQKQLAEDANLAKSRFLAAASHDLRQPVHALGLLVGALKHERLEPAAASLVDKIDAATESLDDLFSALLDISRLDAGVVEPRVRPVAVGPLLERLADEVRPEAEAKGIDVRVRPRDVWVLSDAVMLERIARNLISNAVRHTERGSVLAAVRIVEGRGAIEVWDTGPGIAAHERELVFREFYQADKSRTKGLGLGLSIVRRLCTLLGHEIDLRSRLGRGSVVRVSARLAQAPEAADAAPLPLRETCAGRIWVIDDDHGVRAGMQALLTNWGHEVSVAASADEMLGAYAQDKRLPDAILCDYRLTEGDGFAAIDRLRRELGASVPAALITGDTAPEQLRQAAASGLPVLHKPVVKARLRALIGNLVRAGAER